MAEKDKLLLFDIDGTLLRGYGAGSRAMRRAALEVLGVGCEGAVIEVGGALDPWIFRELARHGGYAPVPELHGVFRQAYARLLVEELDIAAQRCEAMPGVHALLSQLRAMSGVIVGMLTGNYAETASIKLRRVGIDPGWFAPTAWGDDAPDRPALVRYALTHTPHLEAKDVIVIGDTVRDVHCARENGARCLAVLTGGASAAELTAAGAHRVVDDLSDPEPLLAMLLD